MIGALEAVISGTVSRRLSLDTRILIRNPPYRHIGALVHVLERAHVSRRPTLPRAGQYGLGQEVIARFVHPRPAKPWTFVAIDCARCQIGSSNQELLGSCCSPQRENVARSRLSSKKSQCESSDLPVRARSKTNYLNGKISLRGRATRGTAVVDVQLTPRPGSA